MQTKNLHNQLKLNPSNPLDDLEQILKASTELTAFIFYKSASGGKVMMEKIIEKLINHFDKQIDFFQNVLSSVQMDTLQKKYSIRNTPVMLLFKAGELVAYFTGIMSYNRLQKELSTIL